MTRPAALRSSIDYLALQSDLKDCSLQRQHSHSYMLPGRRRTERLDWSYSLSAHASGQTVSSFSASLEPLWQLAGKQSLGATPLVATINRGLKERGSVALKVSRYARLDSGSHGKDLRNSPPIISTTDFGVRDNRKKGIPREDLMELSALACKSGADLT